MICMYHPILGAKIFSADEVYNLGPEWVDTPAKFKKDENEEGGGGEEEAETTSKKKRK